MMRKKDVIKHFSKVGGALFIISWQTKKTKYAPGCLVWNVLRATNVFTTVLFSEKETIQKRNVK